MNELDSRLSAWNPVRTSDVPGAASPDAAELLARILSQPATGPSRRQAPRPRRPARAWIAAAAAIAVAAAGFGVSMSLAGHGSSGIVPSGVPVIGFQQGTSQGVATSVVKLVDYSARAAALTPRFVPGPHEWMYRDLVEKTGRRRDREVTWFEVNWSHMFALWPDGRLTPVGSSTGSCAGQLEGWPGCMNNLYRYLAALPAEPAALRRIILASNHFDPAAAFRAINALMGDYPLPARFQAELYAVVAGLPGVRFDRSATDFAGRHGIGLYMIQAHWRKTEIIINPHTYAFMGELVVATRTHTEYGRRVPEGRIQAWDAVLGSGIVQKPGQRP